ncbi:4a-hydroxytetrahydrobiopterin dehydratase [Janthinobacterium sp. 17J80-10]|uniref:4a-hydroxytetrahydrobiopterin dehydratase n=1 Tax=Janthinobacterium sp. 17J80-10 TaxID=2497863 RepID=UPI00100572EC|nr:4a-hydroxytetrahydrobiopterin dehydratase [Janthinobacterium sp. 17J80-10]QAU35281.1 4a-hydroxytetrahydrobiopterin dehydratase [Janthinobacterium sp. 17J80-10]
MTKTADLLTKKCRHQETALDDAQIQVHLAALPDWHVAQGLLERQFSFRNYYETLAFVNAAAYIAHAEDHHPELTVGYNRCMVRFNTHSVNGGRGGLSENDFICAAKVGALFAQAHS